MNTTRRQLPFHVLLICCLSAFRCSAAETPPPLTEDQKIEKLIRLVETSDMTFNRNGTDYDGKAAADHIRQKLAAADPKPKTALEFIDTIASRSQMSGKEYTVKLRDGTVMTSAQWLKKQLEILTSPTKAESPESTKSSGVNLSSTGIREIAIIDAKTKGIHEIAIIDAKTKPEGTTGDVELENGVKFQYRIATGGNSVEFKAITALECRIIAKNLLESISKITLKMDPGETARLAQSSIVVSYDVKSKTIMLNLKESLPEIISVNGTLELIRRNNDSSGEPKTYSITPEKPVRISDAGDIRQ